MECQHHTLQKITEGQGSQGSCILCHMHWGRGSNGSKRAELQGRGCLGAKGSWRLVWCHVMGYGVVAGQSACMLGRVQQGSEDACGLQCCRDVTVHSRASDGKYTPVMHAGAQASGALLHPLLMLAMHA